ncbi:hypothetical protein ARMGADRAFT_1082854 [Armillaria gallica]|uniref:Uncharacterized protein n=1 Tax=Armillaria gallica TaxID=47427 RepID=A0A2H3D9X3_ARMGA|nr:hypothetical protein ARMGADRAFT_1082854 [Armillaria gallica]
MHLLDCWVSELFSEHLEEVCPVRIPIAWALVKVGVIPAWNVPVFILKMDPPVLGHAFQVQGCEDDHPQGDVHVVLPEHLKVGVAVPKESLNVIVGAFKEFWGSHEDGFDPSSCQGVIYIPCSLGPVACSNQAVGELSTGPGLGWGVAVFLCRAALVGPQPDPPAAGAPSVSSAPTVSWPGSGAPPTRVRGAALTLLPSVCCPLLLQL